MVKSHTKAEAGPTQTDKLATRVGSPTVGTQGASLDYCLCKEFAGPGSGDTSSSFESHVCCAQALKMVQGNLPAHGSTWPCARLLYPWAQSILQDLARWLLEPSTHAKAKASRRTAPQTGSHGLLAIVPLTEVKPNLWKLPDLPPQIHLHEPLPCSQAAASDGPYLLTVAGGVCRGVSVESG